MMKKKDIIVALAALAVIFLFLFYLDARARNEKLSDMSIQECLEFMEEMNVQIPEDFQERQDEINAELALEYIKVFEENIDAPPLVAGWQALSDFYEEIRRAVREYNELKKE